MAEMKKKWIKGAIVPSHEHAFKAKAEHAGETTREFAKEHAGDADETGKQARLAETLMKMRHPGSKKMIKKMYGREE